MLTGRRLVKRWPKTALKMFTREVELESVGGNLLLSQEVEGDVGCVVWDAAIVLAKYLEIREKGEIVLTRVATSSCQGD